MLYMSIELQDALLAKVIDAPSVAKKTLHQIIIFLLFIYNSSTAHVLLVQEGLSGI